MPTSTAGIKVQVAFLRQAAETPFAPSPNGAVNHDSIVYLAKFALGLANDPGFVVGALKCAGATDIQIKAIVEMLVRLPAETSDIEAVVRRVTDELGIPVAFHKAFPRVGEGWESAGWVMHNPQPNAATPKMSGKDPIEQKNGPLTMLLMVVAGFFMVAVFLSFFVLWAREGWSVATQENKVGAALFFFALGFLYLITIPFLRDKGYRSLSTAMLLLALVVGGGFVASFFPSCSGESSELPLERPYRK